MSGSSRCCERMLNFEFNLFGDMLFISSFLKNQNKGVFVVSYNAEKNELASVAIIIVHIDKLYFYTSK